MESPIIIKLLAVVIATGGSYLLGYMHGRNI